MTFRVAARTLLHLGSELISSDSVAFYELIKNGLDAGSRFVKLSVEIVLPTQAYREMRSEIHQLLQDNAASNDVIQSLFEKARDAIVPEASTAHDALARLQAAPQSLEGLATVLQYIDADLNFIEISDKGTGMKLNDLTEVYLVIGTPMRYRERAQWIEGIRDAKSEQKQRRPVLGEKGVGRLSTMRLGNALQVVTSQNNEARWNVLEIDWTCFEDVDLYVEEVVIEPRLGAKKTNITQSGTTIKISKLKSAWSLKKVQDIVELEFSKLTDPFASNVKFPVRVYYNGERLDIPRFNKLLFDEAHATLEAEFAIEPKPILRGKMWYVGHRKKANDARTKAIGALSGTHLVSMASDNGYEGVTLETLHGVGPFKLTLHWYNRQRLTGIDGIGNRNQVLALLRQWAGGVMVYRDGFRVRPYGNLDDDWLDLDRSALARKSFKINRAQMVGKIEVTSAQNPNLLDQTNREGLRDTPEKQALVSLLRWLLGGKGPLLSFLDEVDKEKIATEQIDLQGVDAEIQRHYEELTQTLDQLAAEFPQAYQAYDIRQLVDANRKLIKDAMAEINARSTTYETGRSQLIHLAGIGLMVEILSHELNRATANTLNTLMQIQRKKIDTASAFVTLEAQLKTLQRRLKTLDPLSTRGRQVKSTFDLVDWVRDTLEAHRMQFLRHQIKLDFQTVPSDGARFKFSGVKGMIVQILENLISNSVYWLKQERAINPRFKPEIEIVVDAVDKKVRVSDNGPGIEEARKELVFTPFHSTKPPSMGSGLGLFVAREIAEYHNKTLYLDTQSIRKDGTLNTFVFDLSSN